MHAVAGPATRRAKGIAASEDAKLKDLRWWRAEEPHVAVFANVERLGTYARQRQTQDLYYACLYDDAELASLIQGSASLMTSSPQTMTTNIVRRQVDTFVAKVAKNRPVPMALTTGGNYGQQRRAKALTKFFEGVLDSVGYWKTRTMRLRDGAVFGSGIARNYRVGRKLFHERKFPWEVRVDPIDALHGHPRSIYIRHPVDRLVLMDRYPKKAHLIKDSASRTAEDSWSSSLDDMSDVVVVEEAIHLPSGEPTEKDAKDGAWALCVSNATLEQGDYGFDYHQISKFDFSPPLIGWWGEGMVRQLAGLQYECNSIGLRLQEQGYLTGSYVLVPAGSGIETDTLDNGALTVVRYEGQAPSWQTPAPWHPQFFDYYQKLRGQFASDVTGISGSASRGEGPPPGVESGKAIRSWAEISDEALIPIGREDERDSVDTAWQLFDLMEEIQGEAGEKGDKYTVKVEKRADGRSAIEDVTYEDVRMDKESFTLRTFPTSFLASTPADRWEQVSEMAEKGLFSQDEVLALLDFPDVQRVLNLRGSPRRSIEKIIEKFLDSDDPKPIAPEPTMNLDLCVALGTLAYLEAKWLDEVPEKNTAALLDFITQARALRDSTGGPQAGTQAPGELPGDEALAPVNVPGEVPQAAPPPGPGGDLPPELYAPPEGAPLPANAVAPEAMPALPPV